MLGRPGSRGFAGGGRMSRRRLAVFAAGTGLGLAGCFHRRRHAAARCPVPAGDARRRAFGGRRGGSFEVAEVGPLEVADVGPLEVAEAAPSREAGRGWSPLGAVGQSPAARKRCRRQAAAGSCRSTSSPDGAPDSGASTAPTSKMPLLRRERALSGTRSSTGRLSSSTGDGLPPPWRAASAPSGGGSARR